MNFMANVELRLGVDLGGTKIEIVGLDASDRELLRRRVPTPGGDYQATLDTVATLVHDAEAQLGRRGSVGVGTPGSLSPLSGRLRNSNSICLNGKRIKEDIEARLQRQIHVANDADCLALSEAHDGAAAGARSVFAAILGTGVGAGIVVDGRLLSGPNRIAGEWGHNPLPWLRAEDGGGRGCYCGKTDCIETYLSGPGFAASYFALAGQAAEVPRIVGAARAGDALSRRTLYRYIEQTARCLASVINILDPEVVVFGGGMSNIDELYQHLAAVLGDFVFADAVYTRIVRSQHGDSSGVRGAARLWQAS
jgi:fructokinase